MCRNPWYSIIQEYKYIAEAKRILWNEDLRKEEQERVKILKDVYADICQFKRACDIDFVDLAAIVPGSYEHHTFF